MFCSTEGLRFTLYALIWNFIPGPLLGTKNCQLTILKVKLELSEIEEAQKVDAKYGSKKKEEKHQKLSAEDPQRPNQMMDMR